mgnify:CR=1 FL=1
MGAVHTLWDRLGNITAPTTIACGEITDTITPQYAAEITSRIPGAEMVSMRGLGHFGPIEDPDATCAAILGFARD